MFKEKQKIVHVLDELLNYALRSNPQKVTITIEELEDRVQITVEDAGIELTDRECQDVARFLNTPRRNEMREYYGGLAGEETLHPRNLRIVGMMVDGGQLESCEGGGRLSIWWKTEAS
ncbi:MAG: sensor histidine kinase [Anaerolineae bacterium]|nr:sensor histidine kinase [Anaerolineae bacterium]